MTPKWVVRFFFLLTSVSPAFAEQRVVLFNDTSAWYHWGCTGTSTALRENIESLGFEVQGVPIPVTYSLKEVPQFEEFDDKGKWELFCRENKDVAESIQNSCAVVITGEGTMHDLRAGPRTLLYVAHISKKFFRKHVEIVNHSAYPKDDPGLSISFLQNFGVEKERAEQELEKAQKIYQTIYQELDFVAIREPLSRDEMGKIDISSTLSFDCLPLYIRDHYHNPKQTDQKTLLLAGSVAFSETGLDALCRYAEAMSKKGFEIQVLIGAAAFPSKDDRTFVDFLKAHCQAEWKLIEAVSMEQWLDTIHSATLLVSGRFHHSIAAFCLNTPFIALNSNTHKVHAICFQLGQPEPLLFSDPNLSSLLLARTEAILASPPLNNRVKIDEICQLAERNFDGLKSFNSGL